jgi:hypothetical protein
MTELPKGRDLYVQVTSLAPPKSGLGGSGALRVSILSGIDVYLGNIINTGNYYLDVRKVACGMMNEQAGVQDEKAAEEESSAGLITIDPDDFPRCVRKKITIPPTFKRHAEDCWFIVHFGGENTESGKRHREVIERAESRDPEVSGHTHECLRQISNCSLGAFEAVQNSDLKAFEAQVARNSQLVYEMCGVGPGENMRRLQQILPVGVVFKEPGAWRDNTAWVLPKSPEQKEMIIRRIRKKILPENPSSVRIIPFRFAERGVRVAEFQSAELDLDRIAEP